MRGTAVDKTSRLALTASRIKCTEVEEWYSIAETFSGMGMSLPSKSLRFLVGVAVLLQGSSVPVCSPAKKLIRIHI